MPYACRALYSKMENKYYENMNDQELWMEIVTIVNATQFTDCDKTLILKLIKE